MPILTRGIYRDPLDTLREYVQNSIDAGAHHIQVAITSDLISVRDDGAGMTRQVAERAIRLGMSDKDPTQDVGFRGIGVYSAFNVCQKLEIYTRPRAGEPSKLVFDFARTREKLQDEEQRRLNGKPSGLDLVALLGDSVWVEECSECPIAASGTVVLLVGIRGDVYGRLTDRGAVRQYLESVVPLPFPPAFAYKHQIEARFRQDDYRVVDMELTIDGRNEAICRPYRDSMFTHGKGIGPKFYPLSHVLARGKLGFAWVCLNDARRYLPDRALRGLLVKKFGFSVGDRDYFARYFSRQVFNNRVTGEIIVTRDELVPNAARSEFEPSPIRDALYLAFSNLAAKVSRWANQVQEELKAREELQEISPEVFRIAEEVPLSERDVPKLLSLNNVLSSYESRLRTHHAKLKKMNPGLLRRTLTALAQTQDTIAEVLSAQQLGGEARKGRVRRAGRLLVTAPSEEELAHAREKPHTLVDIVGYLGMDLSADATLLLEYIDREVLQRKLSPVEYAECMADLLAFLEESL